MFDLNNFKLVNDKYGHDIGNLVLKEVSNKIIEFVRSYNDTYTIRLGGDEFLIFIKDNLSDDNIKLELTKLNKLLTKWDTPIDDVNLSSSIGAYRYLPKSISDIDKLLKIVDELLYKAKNNGKNTFVYKSI